MTTTQPSSILAQLLARGSEVGLQYVALDDSAMLEQYAGGFRDIASRAPVDHDTLFLSASSTKVLTAAVVLALWERGALRLEDPLSRYVPEQAYGDEVTVSQLLSHSSGVPNPLPLRWLHRESEHAAYDEDATLRAVLQRHTALQFEPGTRYAYSNLGYWLLGKVIEAVSGMRFAAALREFIALPLGLEERELSCDFLDPAQQARGHVRRWSALGLALPWLVDRSILARPVRGWLRFEHTHMNGPAYGGVRASARAYAAFLQDLLQPRSRVLGDDARRLFFTPQHTRAGRGLPGTLGWHLGALDGEPYLSKPGGGPGFHSNLRIYPRRGLASVYLANRMCASEAQIQRFSDGVDRALLARAPRSESAFATCSRQRQVGRPTGLSV